MTHHCFSHADNQNTLKLIQLVSLCLQGVCETGISWTLSTKTFIRVLLFSHIRGLKGSRDNLLAECKTRDWNVVSSSPGRSDSKNFWRRNFCPHSYLVSIPPHVSVVACKRPWSFCQKYKWQVTPKNTYTLNTAKLEWADYAVQAQCGKLSGIQAHTQLIREHSATVVSAL